MYAVQGLCIYICVEDEQFSAFEPVLHVLVLHAIYGTPSGLMLSYKIERCPDYRGQIEWK
jgi:hypothetical protein